MNLTLMELTPPLKEELWNTIRDLIPRDLSILVVLGVLGVVSLGVFIWAAFLRKRPHRPRHDFHAHPEDSQRENLLERMKEGRLLPHKHHRHRRRRYRRNPTLAEAGGLPPIRSEEQPPAST
jgi:hypothetical protein